ncbi:ABC transporter ATP-binding protein [bacterium]|nr:ABC transporter ATP-binding protein [bacterium]
MSDRILEVEDLSVTLERGGKEITPVQNVSVSLGRGEALGIAGESGCGKSLTLKSIIGLLPPGAIVGGDLRFALDREEPISYESADVHGHGIAIIFQEPMTALNPTMRVGDLIAEGPKIHHGLDRREARERAIELMRLVGIPSPEKRARMWPHQLSGGLRQRVMIAAALSTEPKLLLCDEPTTALDVSIQDQILGLLQELRTRLDMSIIFVSHDLAVIGELCDRIAIMYAGQVVEKGPVDEVFADPKHPYTEALMHSVPSFQQTTEKLEGIEGAPPDPGSFPDGCRFAPRCRYVRDDCATASYALVQIGERRETGCIHPELLEGIGS